jgi:hypothetical protein
MDLTGFEFSDLLHPQTRGLDSENASIEFVILHLRNFRVWEDNKSGQIR